jgi:hypothetical protein
MKDKGKNPKRSLGGAKRERNISVFLAKRALRRV